MNPTSRAYIHPDAKHQARMPPLMLASLLERGNCFVFTFILDWLSGHFWREELRSPHMSQNPSKLRPGPCPNGETASAIEGCSFAATSPRAHVVFATTPVFQMYDKLR